MKKLIIALALALGVALTLTGCDDSGYEKNQQREERMYKLCITNGGSWETSAWDDDPSCIMPKKK